MENYMQPKDTKNDVSIENTGSVGYLVVRVSTARGAIPLEDASVAIRGGSAEESDIVYSLRTGRDGLTERILLPTPASSVSQAPNSAAPFSLWQIEVFREGYIPVSFQNVPVYPDIVSVQPAVLLPYAENFGYGERFNESQTPDL